MYRSYREGIKETVVYIVVLRPPAATNFLVEWVWLTKELEAPLHLNFDRVHFFCHYLFFFLLHQHPQPTSFLKLPTNDQQQNVFISVGHCNGNLTGNTIHGPQRVAGKTPKESRTTRTECRGDGDPYRMDETIAHDSFLPLDGIGKGLG